MQEEAGSAQGVGKRMSRAGSWCRDGWDRCPGPLTAVSSAVKNKNSPVVPRRASGKSELVWRGVRQRWETVITVRE